MPQIKPGLEALKSALGPDAVLTDAHSCAMYAQDVYREAAPVDAVLRPADKTALQTAVRTATQHGLAVFPRGGGWSYSDAYLPNRKGSVCLDTSLLNRIEEINAVDGYVTVEAGCTWKALDEALEPHGMRAEFWGPLSGAKATIGGGISQGSLSLGSAKCGVSAEAVLAMEIVKADGTVFKTGSDAQAGKSPFFRNYGPDLTGMFCGDAGALGIKASVTLKLRPRAKYVQGLSFGFKRFEDLVDGMNAIGKTGKVTESFGFSRYAMENVIKSAGLWNDIKMMFAVGKAAGGLFGGMVQMTKMAIAGRRFLKDSNFFAHIVVEADHPLEMKGALAYVRAAGGDYGIDLPNTAPTVMRAEPFMPYPVVSDKGQRCLPLHGILPYSRAAEFHEGMEQLRIKHAEIIEANEIIIPAMYSSVAMTGFLYEPVLYWKDSANAFHKEHTIPDMLDKMLPEDNIAAREAVEIVRADIVELIHAKGGVHLQIGKTYPYLLDRNEEQTATLKQLKAQIDPEGLINPGALGLGA